MRSDLSKGQASKPYWRLNIDFFDISSRPFLFLRLILY